MTLAVIALGANIEAPIERLAEAFAHVSKMADFSVLDVSPIYQSPPMGPEDQPPYFNAVLTGEYTGEPQSLLRALQKIEASMVRVKTRHWGERCIDLDIVQFGDCVIHLPSLQIPHPGLGSRLFVVQPMIDILGADLRVPSSERPGTL